MGTTTAKQAIRTAVEAELHAARFYALLAESTDEPASRKFLEEMAGLERKHAADIERVGKDLVGGTLAAEADMDVTMIETLPEWRFLDGVTLAQALEIAIAAEDQAALYYDAFSDHLDEPAKAFFLDLARQEEEHGTMLRKKQKELGLA
jgi:rubrerythrin